MVSKTDMKALASVTVGAGVGAVASKYGSNLVSNALTKKHRTGGEDPKAASEVEFWKKAYFYDVVGGVVLAALPLLAPKAFKNDMLKTGTMSAGAYLVANGATDWIGDVLAEDADKTYNGRPLAKATNEDKSESVVGALSRARATSFQATGCGARATQVSAQQLLPPQGTGRVALF